MNRLLLAVLFLAVSTTTYAEASFDAKLGYEHGCNSGSAATGNWTKQYFQDFDKYRDNKDYHMNWDAGFYKCKALGETVNNAIRDSMRW